MVLTLMYVALRIPAKGKDMMLMGMQELMDRKGGGSPVGLEEVQEIHLPSSLDKHRCDTL